MRLCRKCGGPVERREVTRSYSNPDGLAWICEPCRAWWPTSGTWTQKRAKRDPDKRRLPGMDK